MIAATLAASLVSNAVFSEVVETLTVITLDDFRRFYYKPPKT